MTKCLCKECDCDIQPKSVDKVCDYCQAGRHKIKSVTKTFEGFMSVFGNNNSMDGIEIGFETEEDIMELRDHVLKHCKVTVEVLDPNRKTGFGI